jgi:hypothetical protein
LLGLIFSGFLCSLDPRLLAAVSVLRLYAFPAVEGLSFGGVVGVQLEQILDLLDLKYD